MLKPKLKTPSPQNYVGILDGSDDVWGVGIPDIAGFGPQRPRQPHDGCKPLGSYRHRRNTRWNHKVCVHCKCCAGQVGCLIETVACANSSAISEGYVMDEQLLAKEHSQLLSTWRRLLSDKDWKRKLELKAEKYLLAVNSPASRQAAPRERLREFHNDLGYRAQPKKNGLCAGAIFRTQAFIENHLRIGKRQEQSVHLEHTVPIAALDKQLRKLHPMTNIEIAGFLIHQSVVTAFHFNEKSTRTRKGYSNKTDAFDVSSADFNKPFKRYHSAIDGAGHIWNVFDKCSVDPDKFTFEHHQDVIRRIIDFCSARC